MVTLLDSLLLPEQSEEYPLIVAARYKNKELAFVLSKDQLTNDDAIKTSVVALRNCLMQEGDV